MHQSEVPEGIDPKNACKVEIDGTSFPTVEINPMVDKTQWPVVDPGFVMVPPKLERSAGRSRVRRIKSSGEPGKRGTYQYKRCFQFGHIEKTCREPPAELGDELPPPIPAKTRKRKGEAGTSTSNVAAVHTPKKSKKVSTTTSTPLATQSPVSPGPTTRSMAAQNSPQPTTRRRAAALDISPGGIARRIIIS